jgi:hypothetical protein
MHSRLLWPQPSLVKIHSLGFLLIVLLPLAIGLHIENKLRDHEANGLRRRDPKPRVIKTGRQRRRSLNLQLTQLSTSRSHTQSQCKLLTDLPLELRQLIWLASVGGSDSSSYT